MSDAPTPKRPLFTVTNHHAERCGDPPFYDGDEDGAYVGYFTNLHGEQAIFHYDYETKRATLRMGDADWGREYVVTDGHVAELKLDRPEQFWLGACWEAATGEEN
jgi:hypothetical protein